MLLTSPINLIKTFEHFLIVCKILTKIDEMGDYYMKLL